jgi:aubergine-like protein
MSNRGYKGVPISSKEGSRGGYQGGSRDRGYQEGSRGGYQGGSRGRGGYQGGSRSGHHGASASQNVDNTAKPYANEKINPIKCEEIKAPQVIEADNYLRSGQSGISGTKTKMITNYFCVRLPQVPIYQHSVVVSEGNKNLPSRLLSKLVSKVMDNEVAYVFDGQEILFTMVKFDEISKNLQDGDQTYNVTIKHVKNLSSDKIDMSILQAFNLVYRSNLRYLKKTKIGRNFFDLNLKFSIGGNLEIVPGQQQTLYKTQLGLLSCRDVAWKILRTENCLQILQQLQEKWQGKTLQDKFEQEVKKRIMYLPHQNQRTVFITGVNWKMNPNYKFKNQENKEISFVNYYKNVYKYDIKDLSQPMLESRRKSGKIDYYVPEMCKPTGLTDELRKKRHIMQAIKEETGLTPKDRFSSIVHSLRKENSNKDFVTALKRFDYEQDDRPIEIDARILSPETIIFGDNKNQKVENGSWDVKNKKMRSAKAINNWVLVYPPKSKMSDEDPNHEVNMFLETLKKVSNYLGISMSDPTFAPTDRDNLEHYISAIEEYTNQNTSIVLVVLPDGNDARYNGIKQHCEKKELLSQCVTWDTVKSNNMSKTTKIAIAMDTKLGGAPWTLSYKLDNTMIVGMDVYHSGELVHRKKKSVVGLCATMGGDHTKFFSKFIIQEPGKEIVEALEPCIEAAIEQYKKLNKKGPEQILFYRDGVGEGQVQDIEREEIQAIRNAIKKNAKGAKLNYMVVLKRINTRFATLEFSNPPPGTVIDTAIVQPKVIEFFLIAHHANQGTATPTKYQCLSNESNWSSDQFQNITYKLCHAYYNWFGCIRVPAPCQNAHKLAFLVGQSELKKEDTKLNSFLFYL